TFLRVFVIGRERYQWNTYGVSPRATYNSLSLPVTRLMNACTDASPRKQLCVYQSGRSCRL
ncbi:hypothetical protein PDJAM_G00081550, partial [Pangasius djambal]|nr:hypothetical protein [Pangasius djambal]